MGDTEDLRLCRKCLIRDMPEFRDFVYLKDYLAAVREEDRVPDPIYDERLELCRECPKFVAATCLLCGCYSEMRAILRVKGCPMVPPRWRPFTEEDQIAWEESLEE